MSKSKAIIKMVSVILSVVILLTVLPLGVSAADTTPVTLNNSNDVTIQNLPADNSMLAGVDNIDTSLSEAEQLESLTELELSTIISNGKMERISADNVPAVVGFESAKLKNHVARAFEKEKDELNSLVFLNEDGTYTKYIYDYPVKYIDETGKVKDTSLDIVADTNGGYKTKQGNAVARFSEKIRDGITVSGNGVSVEMYPKLPTQVKAPVAIEKITKQPLQSLIQSTEKVNRLDNRTVSYYYDDKTTIEYNLTYLGIKEDIVVSEYTGQTDYYFTLKTGGLALTEIEDNYYLTDENGDVKATLGEVIIFTADEKNNAFGSMSAVTVKENEEYTVTIHVDADYLKDEKTVYPIRIDPTLEIDFDEDGNKLIQDLTINSNSTISHRTTESLRVGKNSDGTYSRILMKFNYDFGSFTDGPLKIHRAYIELRDVMCQTESMSVMSEMYIATNWSESSEWSTIARGTNTHYMATMPINYNKGNAFAVKHRYNISVLDAVKYWVAEANDTPNYEHELPHGGIMIRANDTVEQGDTIITKYFASSDYPTAEYRPSLAITYYDTHTQYSDPFGHLDAVTSNSIRGWVWCVDLPNESIPVTISLTNLTTGESFPEIDLNGEATALYRPDVHSAGYGTGCYGFNYAIDWNQYPAGKYSVTAKAHSMNGSGSQFPLFNGPLEYVNTNPFYCDSNDIQYFINSDGLNSDDNLQRRANCYGFALRMYYAEENIPVNYYTGYGLYYKQLPGEFATNKVDENGSTLNYGDLHQLYSGPENEEYNTPVSLILGYIDKDLEAMGYNLLSYQKYTTASQIPKATTYKDRRLIALVTGGGEGDFHFYMQNTDGIWTHKPGEGAAMKVCQIHTDVVLTDSNILEHISHGGYETGTDYSFFYVDKPATIDFGHNDGGFNQSSCTSLNIKDVAGNQMLNAKLITVPNTVAIKGRIDYLNDIDYYTFTASSSGTYRFSFQTSSNSPSPKPYPLHVEVIGNGSLQFARMDVTDEAEDLTVSLIAGNIYFIKCYTSSQTVYEPNRRYSFTIIKE